jgi:hypothetical protein
MRHLFGEDPPVAEFKLRFDQISSLMWKTAGRVLAAGSDVIMDMGFWTRAARDEARALVKGFGADHRIYAFDCSVTDARARVLARTLSLPAGALYICESTFDVLAARFEPMQPDEEFVLVRSGPNKWLEPTVTAVTPRADARGAPAATVAHH